MRDTAAALAAAVVLVGCATTSENVERLADIDLCARYGAMKNGIVYGASALAPVMAEIERRNLLTTSDRALVDRGAIRTGMSQCALYASWGRPLRENRSVGSWGTSIQHVYNAGLRTIRPTYVYTRNGTVTSWQD